MVPRFGTPRDSAILVLIGLCNDLSHDGSKVCLKLKLIFFKRLEHLVKVLRA